jgi:hypothetical protein
LRPTTPFFKTSTAPARPHAVPTNASLPTARVIDLDTTSTAERLSSHSSHSPSCSKTASCTGRCIWRNPREHSSRISQLPNRSEATPPCVASSHLFRQIPWDLLSDCLPRYIEVDGQRSSILSDHTVQAQARLRKYGVVGVVASRAAQRLRDLVGAALSWRFAAAALRHEDHWARGSP